MDTFKLPELPTILDGRVVMVSDDVLRGMVAYLQELAKYVANNVKDIKTIADSQDTLFKDVSKLAEILEVMYEKN